MRVLLAFAGRELARRLNPQGRVAPDATAWRVSPVHESSKAVSRETEIRRAGAGGPAQSEWASPRAVNDLRNPPWRAPTPAPAQKGLDSAPALAKIPLSLFRGAL